MIKTMTQTPITGHYDGTELDLVEPFRKYSPQTFDRALRLAPLYLKYDRKFNIRADIAWAQMIHETGYLSFKGIAKPEWNNFAGLGITGPGAVQTFKTEDLGVLAHFVHLCWYVFPDHVNTLCSRAFDPRHFETVGKHHPKYNGDVSIARLGNAWAVPGIDYADRIVNYVNIINKTSTGELEDVIDVSANAEIPQDNETIPEQELITENTTKNTSELDLIVQLGHVGRKKGATGTKGEQEFNKKLGVEMDRLLKQTNLKYRIMGADDWLQPEPNEATIFLATHCDGNTNESARGFSMGFKPDTNMDFKEALAKIYQELSGFTRRRDNNTSGMVKYYAWKHINCKYSNLIEFGFLTNKIEHDWLVSHIPEIAKTVVDTIVSFLKG
jgi:N-acetylmuramoyl-L-alanine amidase